MSSSKPSLLSEIWPHRDLLDELTASDAYVDAAVLSPTSALAAHAAHTAEALSALVASRAREEEEDAAAMPTGLPAPVSAPPTAAKTLVFVAENAESYLQGTTRCFLFFFIGGVVGFHFLYLIVSKQIMKHRAAVTQYFLQLNQVCF
jgi:hypothetical protein